MEIAGTVGLALLGLFLLILILLILIYRRANAAVASNAAAAHHHHHHHHHHRRRAHARARGIELQLVPAATHRSPSPYRGEFVHERPSPLLGSLSRPRPARAASQGWTSLTPAPPAYVGRGGEGGETGREEGEWVVAEPPPAYTERPAWNERRVVFS
ncbi:hypothetical protein B0J12DRAFT_745309 [Macrophomina phaseolina]|uniref:Uncharacterized protein n=1 Tax=Macrophomina phaseolina TaxID=35725 RepID=A0ABQ8FVZ1_9PEZI|nr:hypothetical protein B0J12DRAFT_745309 [Macrophomina phaseolina]